MAMECRDAAHSFGHSQPKAIVFAGFCLNLAILVCAAPVQQRVRSLLTPCFETGFRYVGVALGYGVLDVLLLVYIWRTDFQLYADRAMARSEMAAKVGK